MLRNVWALNTLLVMAASVQMVEAILRVPELAIISPMIQRQNHSSNDGETITITITITTFVVTPIILIALRFALYSYFTALVLDPLLKAHQFSSSSSSGSAITISRLGRHFKTMSQRLCVCVILIVFLLPLVAISQNQLLAYTSLSLIIGTISLCIAICHLHHHRTSLLYVPLIDFESIPISISISIAIPLLSKCGETRICVEFSTMHWSCDAIIPLL